ncbi:MAG: sugar ABC transporter substrate-binding protein [Synechococcaceae cyanobacterium SM2_3_1]|nr:sugar ABC transporter substrate-binding protein [Synechococcaceae cyanobacterium SM2_3_1]
MAQAHMESARNCNNIAVLLPESRTVPRWESLDRPLLVEGLQQALPDATISYANANGQISTQNQQAEEALSNGACILVVATVDSNDTTIVERAQTRQVPVIAYDRLIQAKDVAAYVSFDNLMVGELQGRYIAENYEPGARVVMINGSEDDNNAIRFREGALTQLQPLLDQGAISIIHDEYTPDWNNATAQATMEDLLDEEEGNIQIAYVANDGMAGGVISALRLFGLNGKVLVTGQDATVVGIRNILLGDQAMTVYKPIPQQAQATIQVVQTLIGGGSLQQLTSETIQVASGESVPFIKLTPIAVTRDNLASTVIADGFVSQADVCVDVPAGTSNLCP